MTGKRGARAASPSEDIVRLILDGTVVKARIDRKATAISVLVAIGVRRDGQKVLLAIRNMGGESTAAWRAFLDDLDARGLKAPEFVIVDGGQGLEAALAELWADVPVQRCTVHKQRNLLAHAPKQLHDEIKEDYSDMVYAETGRDRAAPQGLPAQMAAEVPRGRRQPGGGRRAAVHLHPARSAAVASARTTNAIERLHEEFKRRIKTQACCPAPRRRHAVLGAARLRPDHHAPGRRLADPSERSTPKP